ncbi:MAG: hypothetical protein IKP43_00435 [Bacteroidaceae bacterium]|nr:hypothetical protein [Bacteroidaceae bacterium]
MASPTTAPSGGLQETFPDGHETRAAARSGRGYYQKNKKPQYGNQPYRGNFFRVHGVSMLTQRRCYRLFPMMRRPSI